MKVLFIYLILLLGIWGLVSCDSGWNEPITIRGGIFFETQITLDGPLSVGVIDENISKTMNTEYTWTEAFNNSIQTIDPDAGFYEFSNVQPGTYMIIAFVDSNENGLWDFDMASNTAEAFGSFPDSSELYNFDYPMSNASIIIRDGGLGYEVFEDTIGDASSYFGSQPVNDINKIYYDLDENNLYMILQFSGSIKAPTSGSANDELAGYLHFNANTATSNTFNDTYSSTGYSINYDHYIEFSTYDEANQTVDLENYNGFIDFVYCEFRDNQIILVIPFGLLGDPYDYLYFGVIVSNVYDLYMNGDPADPCFQDASGEWSIMLNTAGYP